MNDSNPLEKQLQSWTPRRPSAALKDRLFSSFASPETTHPASSRFVWLGLAPATCLLLLSLSFWLAQAETPSYLAASGASNMLASLSLPSQERLPYHAQDPRYQEWNTWSVATFDWTTGVRSLSTTGSFPLWKTNIQKL